MPRKTYLPDTVRVPLELGFPLQNTFLNSKESFHYALEKEHSRWALEFNTFGVKKPSGLSL